jgi:phage terminase large subunit-like protein
MTVGTKRKRQVNPYGVNREWRELFALLPGYDIYRDAAGCWFDRKKAEHAIWFIENLCKHVEGEMAGKPFKLERWQKAFVGALFGWLRYDEYERVVRRFSKVLLYIARKNGKTPLAAAICLYCLFFDGEIGAQIYSAASDAEQAALLFRHAVGMVQQEPALSKRAKVFTGIGQRAITFEAENSSYKVVSAEAKSKHGFNPHVALLDELHMMPRDLVMAFRTALVSKTRKQPIIIYITTADTERESVCNEVHDYGKKVRDGVISDPAFLPVIYEVERDEADAIIDTPSGPKPGWQVPSVWRKANPNLGVSVSEAALKAAIDEACNSPALEGEVKRFNLNVKTENVSRAIAMDRWHACAEGVERALVWRAEAIERLAGRTCYVGLDLGSTQDLTALALVFPGEGRHVDVLPYFWVPGAGVEKKTHEYQALYRQWIRAGYITATDGQICDYQLVRADINKLNATFPFALDEESGKPELAIDRLFQGAQLCSQLRDEDGFEPYAFGQGFLSMAAPTKDFLERVIAGEFHHGANPVLTWMAGNLCCKVDDAGSMKPQKPNSTNSPLKIDGIVAAIMALGRYMVREPELDNPYETRGVLFL